MTAVGGPLAIVVGPPGSGKTTVGTALAARLGVGFRDTDADVEAASGQTIADLFVEFGEEHFRRLEHEAVRAALAGHHGVLALGGGAILDPDTRALLLPQPVVLLDVTAQEAARRVGLNAPRPLLVGNVHAKWVAMMDVRRPLYAQVATVTVDTSGRTPDEIADDIVARFNLTPIGGPQ